MPLPDCRDILRAKAQQLLAQREHGTQELIRKLSYKHPDCLECIEEIVAELSDSDWLNEVRYVQAFIRKEIGLGHGQRHIQQALQQKAANIEVVSQCLQEADVDWLELAIAVRVKKFGSTLPKAASDVAKQMRFLSYRGFDGDTVRLALKTESD
jgi:regulatory protein